MEQSVVVALTPTPRFSTRPTTIQTARSSRHLVTSERDQLMKKERCFSCREVGHRIMDCLSKQKPRSELSVSRMTIQKSEQKESRTKELQAEAPRAEKPSEWNPTNKPIVSHIAVQESEQKKPLIVSSSTLPGDFSAEEALVISCTLGNNDEIKTTALLDTGATGYSFVDPAMARHVCDELQIEPIRLSKPKAI